MSENTTRYRKICLMAVQKKEVGACINCDTLLTIKEMSIQVIAAYWNALVMLQYRWGSSKESRVTFLGGYHKMVKYHLEY